MSYTLLNFGGWCYPQIADFIQQRFIAYFQDLGGFAAVPACFFLYVGYDFFLNPIKSCFTDSFK